MMIPASQNSSHAHVGYSDESNWNEGRYRSIGLVTASVENAALLAERLQSDGKSAEWKDVRTADKLATAKDWLGVAVEQALAGHIRIDVLVWDMKDSRHRDLPGRDDTENLKRMFRWLLVKTADKWPANALWKIYPDEMSGVNWKDIEAYLRSKPLSWYEGQSSSQRSMGLGGEPLGLRPRVEIEQATSEHPLIQLADLFAGMTAFSWLKADNHALWLERQREKSQPSMFEELDLAPPNTHIAKGEDAKHDALDFFHRLSRKSELGAGMSSSNGKGLRTADPARPTNFWHWKPQSSHDRAPIKTKKTNPEGKDA